VALVQAHIHWKRGETNMIVCILGMPRSGSTFSFNIARELLTARGTVHQASCSDLHPVLAAAPRVDHFLMKGHWPGDATINSIISGEARAVCTVRKPEDAIASWMTAFGFPLEQAIVNGWRCSLNYTSTC